MNMQKIRLERILLQSQTYCGIHIPKSPRKGWVMRWMEWLF